MSATSGGGPTRGDTGPARLVACGLYRTGSGLRRPRSARPGGLLMSSIQVRPFRRSDRDQLTQLVNAHAEAVVPGMSVSVNTVLASLERRPGEFIEDPWVAERVTLVAEQRGRVAAAAHLLRYHRDDRAGPAYSHAGEICWLLYWP